MAGCQHTVWMWADTRAVRHCVVVSSCHHTKTAHNTHKDFRCSSRYTSVKLSALQAQRMPKPVIRYQPTRIM